MKPAASPKSPREKTGWNLMLAGFVIVLLAGVAYFAAPRVGNPLYGTVGNYLMAVGLVVYIAGRIVRWRGRRERADQAR